MAAPAHLIIERVTRVAPLGIRCMDEALGVPVSAGLTVTAWPAVQPARRIQAFHNPSGIFVFADLPGMHDIETGSGNAEYWATVPRRPFVVEVVDVERRFLPFRFTADLPVRDIFLWTDPTESVPNAQAGVPLFSAPSRSVPAGLAVVRADLRDVDGEPAAWAVLEVWTGSGRLGRGVADQRGRVAVHVPYPALEPFGGRLPRSPIATELGLPGTALVRQHWPLELQVYFRRRQSVPEIPDLADVLGQPPANLLLAADPDEPLGDQMLKYGRELVVRSRDRFTGTFLPVLLVRPAANSP